MPAFTTLLYFDITGSTVLYFDITGIGKYYKLLVITSNTLLYNTADSLRVCKYLHIPKHKLYYNVLHTLPHTYPAIYIIPKCAPSVIQGHPYLRNPR